VVSLVGSSDTGRTWHPLTAEHPLLDGNAQLVRVSARDAWLLSCCQWGFQPYPHVATRAVVLVTHDGGIIWRHVSDPCATSPGWESRSLAALAPSRVWVLCGGEPATDMADKVLFASQDGGRRWQKVAATCRWTSPKGQCPRAGEGDLPSIGYSPYLLMTTPHQGWIIGGRGNLEGTWDGGQTWRAPMPALGGYANAMPLSDVTFVDPLHGWLAANCGVYRTVDGGLHWHLWLLGDSCGPGYTAPPTDGQ
jgi:hypothetical protein